MKWWSPLIQANLRFSLRGASNGKLEKVFDRGAFLGALFTYALIADTILLVVLRLLFGTLAISSSNLQDEVLLMLEEQK